MLEPSVAPEIVFISDLHLHPDIPAIKKRFEYFMQWITQHRPQKLYILGDLFHVWVGDDCVDTWMLAIAAQFQSLVQTGVVVYFMPGNRDFLLGSVFAKIAGFTLIDDPIVIELDNHAPVLLAHGDAYCLLDLAHQRFRNISRNPWLRRLFLAMPRRWRHAIVMKIRKKSQQNYHRAPIIMDVVPDACIRAMQSSHVHTLIHGHTHRPGLSTYNDAGACCVDQSGIFKRYVLSDWDDNPQILCYYKSIGIRFVHLEIQ